MKPFGTLNIPQLGDTRNHLAHKYITKPFFDTINERGIKIITAPTGFGKTYSIWNTISTEYLKHYGDIHIHVAPHTETIDRNEIDRYLSPILNTNTFIFHNGDDLNFKDIRYALLYGYKVIIILSDRRLMEWSDDTMFSPLHSLIRDYEGRVLVTRDELSYGTTTQPKNYVIDKGYSNKGYRGTYFKDLYQLYEAGANVYGFTATPTREHLKEIESKHTKYFNVVNEWPSKQELVPFQKWFNIMETTSYCDEDYHNDYILLDELEYINNEITSREQEYESLKTELGIKEDHKFTGILSVQTDHPTVNYKRITIKEVLEKLQMYPNIIDKRYTIIIPTWKGWKEYTHDGIETGNGGEDNEWLEYMNDPNSPARIMVVIYKGNYGINISNLCVGVSLRNPKPKHIDTHPTKLIQSGLQLLGRLGRLNITAQDWNRIQTIQTTHGNEKLYQYLMCKNTFNFRGVGGGNGYWDEVIHTYQQKYGNSYMEMVDYMSKE